jgi:DNA-binding winged helix-turn-helix (wHTH) protein
VNGSSPLPPISEAVVIIEGSRILFANGAAAELVGADEHVELVGMTIESFICASGEPALAAVRSRLANDPQGPHELAMSLRRLSGETVDVDASFSMVEWNGRGVGRVAVREIRPTTRTARRAIGASEVLSFGPLRLDLRARLVTRAGRPIDLTMMEFDLLAFLAARPGQTFSRAELLDLVWHSAAEWQDSSTVTEHVHRIRSKIETGSTSHRMLNTVRGVGYRFDGPAPTILRAS